MTDQPYHHGKLREALLERAMETIEEAGVDGLSLRQLARDVNVSHGAPAKHFRDKQALIDAVAMAGFESMNRRIRDAAQSYENLRGRFVSVGKAYVDFAVEHPALLTVMYSTKHHPDSSDELRSTGAQGIHLAQAMIAEAQEAGVLAPGNPETLAMVCFVSLHGTALLAAGGQLDGNSVEDVVIATTDTLWAGMTAGVPAAQVN
ncbi:TetR/AcrR family transcriptional regulator [Paenarthrobacter sp. MSM-2-10-13]|jgi:AcrR family transcriptional regulator|uniref:TetR/AcrR family transcriptional regulator n=1 Tax=Micrococcaceae TaxID=1268 RepID=UPI00115D7DDD|nr:MULTISPECIES: TetR-like C-terminal domain-containing protein [Micrococcaceae]NHW48410.1 TetR/AcrR family transcriptional regulator [Paenarthrobacter sp. MSM-2-10-13]TQS93258.1 TetR/AcrR family transcriptional regulator [Arthrobacter sp. TS-15]BCW64847.1 TetR family transcriptional regulator [Arthrobacter sp. StoSoilB22]